MGQVITFYSYKGGVGRTMALANIATLLVQWGHKVLLVDWDLEAPGLEFYFQDFINVQAVTQQRGLVDLLVDAERDPDDSFSSAAVNWQDMVVEIAVPDARERIHLITAGRRDQSGSYFDRVTQLDWASFYEKKGGFLIERLRSEWKKNYDYVLVDSRTGITDIGGICTIQLPDVLVLLFTATEQSLKGIVEVASKANAARRELPFDRYSLNCLPVPSRFDSNEEFTISRQWLQRFAEALKDIYDDWLPRSIERRQFLEVTKIPYSSYFSFGEKLPVIEQGTTDPTGLGYAYENIATILSDKFESVEELLSNRDGLVAEQLPPTSQARIFIAHSSTDKALVLDLYDRLKEAGYRPWLDYKDLLPGQSWPQEIEKAIDHSDVILVCLSSRSMESFDHGYVTEELKIVLNKYAERPRKELHLVPIRFDDFSVPNFDQAEYGVNLRHIQWMDYWVEGSFKQLIRVIEWTTRENQ